jgi:hypothetical protein
VYCKTGEQAAFSVVAKDQKGVRKSLGGDTFALSWTRAGSADQPHAGRVRRKLLANAGCARSHTRFVSKQAALHQPARSLLLMNDVSWHILCMVSTEQPCIHPRVAQLAVACLLPCQHATTFRHVVANRRSTEPLL